LRKTINLGLLLLLSMFAFHFARQKAASRIKNNSTRKEIDARADEASDVADSAQSYATKRPVSDKKLVTP